MVCTASQDPTTASFMWNPCGLYRLTISICRTFSHQLPRWRLGSHFRTGITTRTTFHGQVSYRRRRTSIHHRMINMTSSAKDYKQKLVLRKTLREMTTKLVKTQVWQRPQRVPVRQLQH